MSIRNQYPSIKPSLNLDFANTKTLDPRFTFTRASEGRFYDGKTFAKAEENLLLNSAILSTQAVPTVAQPYTLSFIGTGTVTLSGTSTAGPLVGTGATNRVSLTFTPTAGQLTLTVSGTVEQAQLEQRSQVTAYTPTTTQPISNSIPVLQTASANVARFDHNPITGESLGLLIEEQRTNLLTYSEQFDNAAWVKTGATVTANTAVAPDGTLTADKLVEDTSVSSHYTLQNITPTASTNYTGTIFVKAAGRGFALFGLAGGGSDDFASINLSTGATAVVTGSLVAHSATNVGNGWWRFSITKLTSSTAQLAFDIRTSTNGVWANQSYTGDGVSGIFVWGAQIETGAFPTSYIPTVASQVTRNADSASMTGANFSSWYRTSEGTLYAETQRRGTSQTASEGTGIEFASGISQRNMLQLMYDDGSTNIPRLRVFPAGSTSSASILGASGSSPNFTAGEAVAKFAVAFKDGDSGLSKDGSVVTTRTNAFTPPPVTSLQIRTASFGAQGSDFNGTIRKIAYYPARLTNAQLQALTR